MFVRVKKIGGYEYLYLVENAREGGRHVQRLIRSLGRRDEVEASRRCLDLHIRRQCQVCADGLQAVEDACGRHTAVEPSPSMHADASRGLLWGRHPAHPRWNAGGHLRHSRYPDADAGFGLELRGGVGT